MLLGQFETVAEWRLLEQYLDGIRGVTKEDILRVAKQYFSDEDRTVGILMPIKKP
jgi:zinc protease